jgi:hypothetical protein
MGLKSFVSTSLLSTKVFFSFFFFQEKRMNPSRKKNDESQTSRMHVIPSKLVYLKNSLDEHLN